MGKGENGKRNPSGDSNERDPSRSVEQHLARCVRWFGSVEPSWFVFPFSNRRRPVDPKRPITSLKKAWACVRKEAGVVCRLHDLRHSFCTKLWEASVPESTMLDMMGHVSLATLGRYSHVRARARQEAIRVVEARFSWGPKVPPKVNRMTQNLITVIR